MVLAIVRANPEHFVSKAAVDFCYLRLL